MGWQTPEFTITDARSNRQDVYDLLITEWGVPISPTGALQFPPINAPGLETSLAAIAIGPRSTVDRCYVTWNLQKKLQPAATPNAIRRVSVGSPLMFPMPAKAGTIGNSNDAIQAMTQGNLYIFPKTTAASFAFPDQQDSTETPVAYTKSFPSGGLPVVEPFGTSAAAGVFLPPYLHLVLYLKAPYMPPPTARLPLVSRGVMNAVPHGPLPTDEVCIAQVPVYGRKHIVIQFAADQVCDFRIGALRALAVIGGTSPLESQEPNATAAAVPKNTDVRMQLDNPNADYIMLYARPNTIDADVKFVIAAYD